MLLGIAWSTDVLQQLSETQNMLNSLFPMVIYSKEKTFPTPKNERAQYLWCLVKYHSTHNSMCEEYRGGQS